MSRLNIRMDTAEERFNELEDQVKKSIRKGKTERKVKRYGKKK